MGRAFPRAVDQARRDAILFASLEYLSKKRTARDTLPAGKTPVAIVVEAAIGKANPYRVEFRGQLAVGADQPSQSSSAPDTATVVGYLLEQLGESQRAAVLVALPRHFDASGSMPDVPEARASEAADLLKRLRSYSPTTRRGNVVFELETTDGDDSD